MGNKYFEQFLKTGKVKDYLNYKYELAKEQKVEYDKKTGDNPKPNGLPRKS